MGRIVSNFPLEGYCDSLIGGRKENQDSLGFIDTQWGHLALVCDGMGGGPSGKLASHIAVEKMKEAFTTAESIDADDSQSIEELMHEAVKQAHQAIIDEGIAFPQHQGMGSTLTAVLFSDYAAFIAHVGDSRVYLIRGGQKVFCTADHSWVGEKVRNGELSEEQARLSAQSNIITRCLGGKSDLLADVDVLPYVKGDRIALCTDGIWGALPEKELLKRLANAKSVANAVESTVILVDEVGRKEGNHHDNLTVSLYEMHQNSKLKPKMSKKSTIAIVVLLACLAASACFNYSLLNDKRSAQQNSAQASKTIDSLNAQIKNYSQTVEKMKNTLEESKKKGVQDSETIKSLIRALQLQAQDSTASSNAEADDITALKDEVLQMLNKAKGMNETPQRKTMRLEIEKKINQLSARASASGKQNCLKAVQELKKQVATRNGAACNHQYESIISLVNTIK
ncbi:MAG: protein phosphatase 2C domain-containing protein [Bacteroidales bacterium]|nr:protein phosphatase 2C domain-containing protein [Bacteroidales bacterium]